MDKLSEAVESIQEVLKAMKRDAPHTPEHTMAWQGLNYALDLIKQVVEGEQCE